MRNLLVTGGAGFIGSNFLYFWTKKYPNDKIIVLDALTYAGILSSINSLIGSRSITFIQGNICNNLLVEEIFIKHNINLVVHFAAESHVDRSIDDPEVFIKSNIQGTHVLLLAALSAWKTNFEDKLFHHVSTDEVYGDLDFDDPAFTEKTPYSPRSPYAASKASSDMLVRSYFTTYGLPITISNCSNNYGPFQFPEKLIPLILINALEGKRLPIYGNGSNIRDWLFVDDHCYAIDLIIEARNIGETFNVGVNAEISNLDLVNLLCEELDKKFASNKKLSKRFPLSAPANIKKTKNLIYYVKDRPGHDLRYAIDASKIINDLNFKPKVKFAEGISKTIDWYLDNDSWLRLISDDHKEWINKHYKYNN
jgi:dTDP-glucose 4,6-dehydratase